MPSPSPLKAAAASRGETLASVAAATGYTTRTIYSVSNGAVSPWPEMRRRLAEHFGFDVFAQEGAA